MSDFTQYTEQNQIRGVEMFKRPLSDSYAVITSRQIAANPDVPGFLLTLSGQGIIPPTDRDLWPAQQYLAEHRKEWRL